MPMVRNLGSGPGVKFLVFFLVEFRGLGLWFLVLETNLASRWEGARLPGASGKSPDFPGSSPNFPRSFFGDFPGSSLTVELNSNPGVPRKFPGLPRKFPGLPRKFPGLPRKFPGLPRRSALYLGSLTPSPDSQKLSRPWIQNKIQNTKKKPEMKYFSGIFPEMKYFSGIFSIFDFF